MYVAQKRMNDLIDGYSHNLSDHSTFNYKSTDTQVHVPYECDRRQNEEAKQ